MLNQEVTSIIGIIFTIIGFYFAYYQWNKTVKSKRSHLLKILKVHLDCLGPWMGIPGMGYGQHLTEEQKFENADPYKLIYNTASEPLINTTLLESISGVPEDIIGEIDQLYYDLVRIKNLNDFKNLIIANQPKTSRQIKTKLDQYIVKNGKSGFINFYQSLSVTEQFIVLNNLVYLGEVLHCRVIGSKDNGARNHWEKIMNWVKKEIKQKIDIAFILITFITSSLAIAILTNNILFGTSNLILKIFLCVAITFILSLKNEAIIINNTE